MNSHHGSLSRPQRKSLPRTPVSEDAIARACNSVNLSLLKGQTMAGNNDCWQPHQEKGKPVVSCQYLFVTPDGQSVGIIFSLSSNGDGNFDKHLLFEPQYLNGKRIWIDRGILKQLHEQAREAYTTLFNPGTIPGTEPKTSG